MKLSFNDIITKKYLEPIDVEIIGLGTVTIHPLSAADAFNIVADINQLEGEVAELHVARCCCRMLKGVKPTEKEVKAFRANVTASTIREIYLQGLAANGVDNDAKRDIEKN